MRIGIYIVWLIVVALLVGCGRRASQSVTPVKPPNLQAILTQVAETGSLDEVKEAISTQIEKIEETDAVKAKELAAEFEALRTATTPAQLKQQARKMAAKL